MNKQLDETVKKHEMLDTAIREDQKKINYHTLEYPLEFFAKIITQEEIDKYLHWDTSQQSSFIESILIGLPVLKIVVNNDIYQKIIMDNETIKLEIVDGKQRLYTTINFINGNFKLCNLKTLSKLNGFTFSDLLLSRQRKFLRITVKTIEILPDSDISYWLDYKC